MNRSHDSGSDDENNGRLETLESQEYASVDLEDIHGDDDDLDSEVNGNNGTNGGTITGKQQQQQQSPRRRRPPPRPSDNLYLRLWVMSILTFAVLGGLGLVGYRQYSLRQKHRAANNTGSSIANTGSGASAAGQGVWTVSPYNGKDSQPHRSGWNPFDLTVDEMQAIPHPPSFLPSSSSSGSNGHDDDDDGLGYIMQPHMLNNTLVVVSQGDVYYLSMMHHDKNSIGPLPAMRLTTTAGNVRHPTLHPTKPWLLAYTATYTGRREVYVMDLSLSSSSSSSSNNSRHHPTVTQRLTYMDAPYGVLGLSGWKGDSVVFSAYSNTVSLPDIRLYTVAIVNSDNSDDDDDKKVTNNNALAVVPVPLAQATDGVYADGCWYFVRFRQSSVTRRYVGGTAESLWVWCDGDNAMTEAVRLDPTYKGTMKQPRVHDKHLYFISDRDEEGTPTNPNLWAVPLPKPDDKNNHEDWKLTIPIRLTDSTCQFNGMPVMEYSVDAVTGGVVVRLGASLYHLTHKEVQSRLQAGEPSSTAKSTPPKPKKLPIRIYSDFAAHQERLIPIKKTSVNNVDVVETALEQTAALITVRGQVWMVPVVDKPGAEDGAHGNYQGGGQNIPQRRYRVAPGALTGGSTRILMALSVPYHSADDEGKKNSKERYAVLLGTYGAMAEHVFWKVRVDTDAVNLFATATDDNAESSPMPLFQTGTALGSVKSMEVSPCGRRLAWTDTDGRIAVASIVTGNGTTTTDNHAPTILATNNDIGEPLNGAEAEVKWSPGGRYLAISNAARNQFQVITIADCGDPEDDVDIKSGNPKARHDITVKSLTQVTPDRFNSYDPYFGFTTRDIAARKISSLVHSKDPPPAFTTLFFVSDRNVQTDVGSPWGTRAPGPHFKSEANIYALPLVADNEVAGFMGTFSGGGTREVFADDLLGLDEQIDALIAAKAGAATKQGSRRLKDMPLTERALLARQLLGTASRELSYETRGLQGNDGGGSPTTAPSDGPDEDDSKMPKDADIIQTDDANQLMRRAYRIAHIPTGKYYGILTQTQDDASLVMMEKSETVGATIKLFKTSPFPDDYVDVASSKRPVTAWGEAASRDAVYLRYGKDAFKVVSTKSSAELALALTDLEIIDDVVDTEGMALSVWPALEYQQMYSDAWRMLRDYFYDPDLHQVDWQAVHARYLPLVQKCSKREELDDVLAQMASELSALHTFVYGGEYDSPFDGDDEISSVHEPASLGATLERVPEWKGYMVSALPQRDPDFNLVSSSAVYCPIDEQTLAPTGQRGLQVGDVIVGVNGESVMRATDIHMLLRGTAGRSVRLEVLRLSQTDTKQHELPVESVVVVPITADDASDLRYNAWEWKTRESAKAMAKKEGFSVAYIHMRTMGTSDMNDFARNFFPDYDKDALILDVRHNRGGNIDSWIISFLQRQAWMYWGDRVGVRTGSLDWDEQFAFRGHIVVLIDEHTSSDGEGVSRGLSELGLGRLVGTRTWGGGIWLSSDNHLVDSGIATAAEIGTFNENFGWGLGIEQQGVNPDIVVDNNPRSAFDGIDTQLERAIQELKQWLQDEPVIQPKSPGAKPDRSNPETCSA